MQRQSDDAWLAEQFDGLTTEIRTLSPSQWAEQCRYLPPSVTALPGPFSWDVCPYLREVVDCFDVASPIREVALQKGAQICATVAVLENILGYTIAEVKTAPVMLVTADAELAKLRLEINIIPMLQASGLDHLIRSTDESNSRKTGKTDKKLEWLGGGYCIPTGAKNPAKGRSASIRFLARDEIDGWPLVIGSDGDPLKVFEARTSGYELTRKIFDASTPTIKGQSKIEDRFLRGDQRYYFVRCLKCNAPQRLRFRHENRETGVVTGLTWELEEGRLVPGSVRYLCVECSHPHTNDDKTRLLSPAHGAEWRPTAVPQGPHIRSYHLSALYSPVGMRTWDAIALAWLEAWDVERAKPKDTNKLQVFYNNDLGESYRIDGEKVRFEAVSAHRRAEYFYGQVPNKFAAEFCGSPVLLLTCSVDVHADNLAVSVFGWCRDRRAFLVDYWRFEGSTEQLDNPLTWGRLQDLVLGKEYGSDDGKLYRIALTLIDSGYRADDVYRFSDRFGSGVFPVKGRDAPPKSAALKEFSEFVTPMGTRAFGITVDFYKDRWASALRREWSGIGLQPHGHFNAPLDATDRQLKELTVETKKERVSKTTGRREGFDWVRPSGAANELWDLLIYANAGLDMLAWNAHVGQLERASVNWVEFFDQYEQQRLFFTVPNG